MPNSKQLPKERPRIFWLYRSKDISGVSGTGFVAEGVEFSDGQVIMSWLSHHHTMIVAPNIKEIENIHGHSGATKIVWEK